MPREATINATILVVSEQKPFGISLKQRLESIGHMVLRADSTNQAIMFLREQGKQVLGKELLPADMSGSFVEDYANHQRHGKIISTVDLVISEHLSSEQSAAEFVRTLRHDFPFTRAIVLSERTVDIVRLGSMRQRPNPGEIDDAFLAKLVKDVLVR
ncbi:MAG: hypothetical protein PHW53_03305 [Patescibacteria group bacterium]|nr:hypothetical protein [Patescibacteria group bacterium]